MYLKKTLLAVATGALVLAGSATVEAGPKGHEVTSRDYQNAYVLAVTAAQEHYQGSVDTWIALFEAESNNLPAPGDDASLRRSLSRLFERAGDRQVRLLSPYQADLLEARRHGSTIGVGFDTEPVALNFDGLEVTRVEPYSTADDAGLKAGDIIVTINGRHFSEDTIDEVSALLSGAPSTVVLLTVYRGDNRLLIPVEHDPIDGKLGITDRLYDPTVMRKVVDISDQAKNATGLRDGDVIASIDGRPTSDMTGAEVDAMLNRGLIGGVIDIAALVPAAHRTWTGQVVHHRVTRSLIPSVYGAGGMRMSMTSMEKAVFTLGIGNLDFVDAPTLIDDTLLSDGVGYNKVDDVLLDLRGSSGNDPDLAARIASRFVENGALFQVHQWNSHDGLTIITYKMDHGSLVKTISGHGGVENVPLGTPKHIYQNKLVVLVDGGTSRTAEALASALQALHRATVVGWPTGTAGLNQIVSTFAVPAPQSTLTVEVPTAVLANADGRPLTGVHIDHFALLGSMQKEALYQATGEFYDYDPMNDWRFLAGLLGFAVITIAGAAWLGSRSKPKLPSKPAGDSIAGGALSLEKPVEKPVEKPSARLGKGKSTAGKWERWGCLAFSILLIGFVLAAPRAIDKWMHEPPAGSHVSMSVTFYSDGSELSNREAAIIEALSHDYAGAIHFKVVDLRQHPEDVTGYHKQYPGPWLDIYKQMIDAKGKVVSQEGESMGIEPKRILVSFIDVHIPSNNDFIPAAPVRHLKADFRVTG